MIDGSEVIVVGNQAPGVRRRAQATAAPTRSSSISCGCRSTASLLKADYRGHLLVERCARCSSATTTPRSIAKGSARWLGSFSTFAGTVVIREPGGRLRKRIAREIKRVGWWRFLDVLAFRVVSTA